MPHYQRRGEIPGKRHVQFRKPDGSLYPEELVSTEGFSNIYSIIYHEYEPTRVLEIDEAYSVAPEVVVEKNMQNRAFRGFDVQGSQSGDRDARRWRNESCGCLY